jgi:hypothetical protein
MATKSGLGSSSSRRRADARAERCGRFAFPLGGRAGRATQKTYISEAGIFWRGKAGRFPCPLTLSLLPGKWHFENCQSENHLPTFDMRFRREGLFADLAVIHFVSFVVV